METTKRANRARLDAVDRSCLNCSHTSMEHGVVSDRRQVVAVHFDCGRIATLGPSCDAWLLRPANDSGQGRAIACPLDPVVGQGG